MQSPLPTRRLRRLRLGNAVVALEQLEHPVRIDNAHLQNVESVRQLTDGTVQHEHIQNELQHHTQHQFPFDHMANAQPQQQTDACRAQHLDHWEEHTEYDGTDVSLAIAFVDFRNA